MEHLSYPLHCILEVWEVVETERDAGGGDGGPVHVQQLLYSAPVEELDGKLLVAQQHCQVLEHTGFRIDHT